MQTNNLNLIYRGQAWVGFTFADLPLDAALQVACGQIDQAADIARASIVNDPLRALEHERAASEARTFRQSGYSGETPPYVKAWAEAADLEPQAAADSILAKADAWDQVLLTIRGVRLKGKQEALKAITHNAAEIIADAAIAQIKGCVEAADIA
ncbi:hypothetical protein [Pseudomonas sp. NBRC 111118]|uniref:hypothetical protein n=1 Tax=Pseudomonas sp. NBRC 111118 TaxID=1661033 RepID=UPI0006D3C22B|nr:hypothetical protein [Pseudomonas sp. NBRC 111118]